MGLSTFAIAIRGLMQLLVVFGASAGRRDVSIALGLPQGGESVEDKRLTHSKLGICLWEILPIDKCLSH